MRLLVSILVAVTVGTSCSAGDLSTSPPVPGQSPRDERAYEDSLSAARQERVLRQTESAVCESLREGATTVVRYIGSTDEPLLRCALRHASLNSVRWVITSPGGVSDYAIPVAYLFAARNWDIDVSGYCASSCANYLLPAARRVTITKYSFVLLHGSPHTLVKLTDVEKNIREQLSKFYPNDTLQEHEERARDALDALRSTTAVHDDFAETLNVGSAWYAYDPKSSSLEQIQAGDVGFLVADRALFQSCIPRGQTSAFWQPGADNEWKAIREFLPDATLFRRKTREAISCP